MGLGGEKCVCVWFDVLMCGVGTDMGCTFSSCSINSGSSALILRVGKGACRRERVGVGAVGAVGTVKVR
jgi:hypothetical protein